MESLTDKGYKIYIGGLLDTVTKDDIEEEFKKYGEINDIWIARNPPGFAFVFYNSITEAERAIKTLDGSDVFGSQIKVEFAKSVGKKSKPTRQNRTGPNPGGKSPRYSQGGYSSNGRMSGARGPIDGGGAIGSMGPMAGHRGGYAGPGDSGHSNIDLLKNILRLVSGANPNRSGQYDEPQQQQQQHYHRYGDESIDQFQHNRRMRDRSPVHFRDTFDRRMPPRDNYSPAFNGRNNIGRRFQNF